ncbi:MAG: hypothetical protein KatS3mg111_2772 [Pirellulaceae bacterium]|nr:MAG: hypothetical protein KatS3mg111_2772 [Pirellulaceae bacterium]
MRRLLVGALVLGLCGVASSPALAIKQLNDHFKKLYAGDDADEGFKMLVDEAKCNVCHVDRENKKKVRNPYGKALHEVLEEAEFPLAEFKKDPEKYAEELTKLFKKVEGMESGSQKYKTFADRMKAGLLPGGDVKGKPDGQ